MYNSVRAVHRDANHGRFACLPIQNAFSLGVDRQLNGPRIDTAAIGAKIWRYLAARFRREDESEGAEEARRAAIERLSNAPIIPTAMGLRPPSSAFVATNASIAQALGGVEIWSDAEGLACAEELQSTRLLSDFGPESNELIQRLGGKSLDGTGASARSTESFFSELLLAHVPPDLLPRLVVLALSVQAQHERMLLPRARHAHLALSTRRED